MRMPMHDESVAGGGALVALHRLVVHVEIRSFAFRPARLVVSPGTRVVWTNRDGDPHTVTSRTRAFASDALDTAGSFRFVFGRAGTYSYYCAIHPYMHGVVVVRR
jgi:plastocyanin